jgi:predicted CXXCH cytochrome family protein
VVDRRQTAKDIGSPQSHPCVKSALTLMRLILAAAFLAIAAAAQQHPTMLDPNVNATACIGCHQNQAKNKNAHSATEKNCLSCHEVRVSKDVTRVKLLTATPTKLCLQCHSKKEGGAAGTHVHDQATRDCLTCHDPHASGKANDLLKATSGATPAENLCLTCHKTGLNVPKGGSRHEALDLGCDSCHVTHKSGDKSNTEFAYHLTKSSPALCLECHDAGDAGLIKAHNGQPFGKADCVTCHDPHQSLQPKLMQAFVHPPFGEKLCEVCHEAPKNGKVVLTQAKVKDICVGCHSEQADKIEKSKFQHPGAEGDCTDCHNPHAGKTRAFPKPDAVNVCLNCHVDQAEQGNKKVLHQPAFEQGCTTCHDPHGGEHPKLLRAEGNGVCTECHGTGSTHPKLQNAHAVTIFDGKVQLPEDYFAAKHPVQFDLKDGIGHPVGRHPVTDVRDPADPSKVKWPLGCLSCHQPHSGAARAMLVKDLPSSLQFCRNCHQQNFGAD